MTDEYRTYRRGALLAAINRHSEALGLMDDLDQDQRDQLAAWIEEDTAELMEAEAQ